jgi:hypothetical protein
VCQSGKIFEPGNPSVRKEILEMNKKILLRFSEEKTNLLFNESLETLLAMLISTRLSILR